MHVPARPHALDTRTPASMHAFAGLHGSAFVGCGSGGAGAWEAIHRAYASRGTLRRAYELLKEHLELLCRRIYLAKAERVDVQQLELECVLHRLLQLEAKPY